MSVEQDWILENGHRQTHRVEIADGEQLAQFGPAGGWWLIPIVLIPVPLGEFDGGPIALSRRRAAYSEIFPVLGGTSPTGGAVGAPVKVHVDFTCRANAEHRNAEAGLSFGQDDGGSIQVHEVMLREL